jgi:hypothetical protein
MVEMGKEWKDLLKMQKGYTLLRNFSAIKIQNINKNYFNKNVDLKNARIINQNAVNRVYLHFLQNPELYEASDKDMLETYKNLTPRKEVLLEIINSYKKLYSIIDAYDVVFGKNVKISRQHKALGYVKGIIDKKKKDIKNPNMQEEYLKCIRDVIAHDGAEIILNPNGMMFVQIGLRKNQQNTNKGKQKGEKGKQIIQIPVDALKESANTILTEHHYEKFKDISQRERDIFDFARSVLLSKDHTLVLNKIARINEKPSKKKFQDENTMGLINFLKEKTEEGLVHAKGTNNEAIFKAYKKIRDSIAHNFVKIEDGVYKFYIEPKNIMKKIEKSKKDSSVVYTPGEELVEIASFKEKDILKFCEMILNTEEEKEQY